MRNTIKHIPEMQGVQIDSDTIENWFAIKPVMMPCFMKICNLQFAFARKKIFRNSFLPNCDYVHFYNWFYAELGQFQFCRFSAKLIVFGPTWKLDKHITFLKTQKCYEDAFLQNVMQIVCQIHKKIMNNCAHNSVYAFMPFPVASGNEVLVGQQFLLQYI